MARSYLVIELVKAGMSGDHNSVRRIAEEIAADERAKRHPVVADRIFQVLANADQKRQSMPGHRGGQRVSDGPGGTLRKEPQRPLAELFLDRPVRDACLELIQEQRRADVLRAHGVEPRHRLLLVGPPGNGKTSLAECLAYELALPLFIVRYETLVTSYLGETAQRLRRLFDHVGTHPCVLFFDEFDAIGKERGDLHETGEIKRVVTTLLLQLDELPTWCVVVCATNHPELLDRATWRRFEIRLDLNRPSDDRMAEFFAHMLTELPGKSGYTAKRLRAAVNPQSFSEAEDFFLDLRRQIALKQDHKTIANLVADRVNSWTEQRGQYGTVFRPSEAAPA